MKNVRFIVTLIIGGSFSIANIGIFLFSTFKASPQYSHPVQIAALAISVLIIIFLIIALTDIALKMLPSPILTKNDRIFTTIYMRDIFAKSKQIVIDREKTFRAFVSVEEYPQKIILPLEESKNITILYDEKAQILSFYTQKPPISLPVILCGSQKISASTLIFYSGSHGPLSLCNTFKTIDPPADMTVIQEIIDTIKTNNIDITAPVYIDGSLFTDIVQSGKIIGEMNLKEKFLLMIMNIFGETELYSSMDFIQTLSNLLFKSMRSRFSTTGTLWPVKGYHIVETHERDNLAEVSTDE